MIDITFSVQKSDIEHTEPWPAVPRVGEFVCIPELDQSEHRCRKVIHIVWGSYTAYSRTTPRKAWAIVCLSAETAGF